MQNETIYRKFLSVAIIVAIIALPSSVIFLSQPGFEPLTRLLCGGGSFILLLFCAWWIWKASEELLH
jgi:hypothetical protein